MKEHENSMIPEQVKPEENVMLKNVSRSLSDKMVAQDEVYRSNEALMEETKRQKYYYVEKHDAGKTGTLAHEKKYGLRAIRDAIKRFFGFKSKDVFAEYDKLASSEKEEDRKLELHHSLGTKLMDEGQNVMEIDVGGSGYYAFRKSHAGFFDKKMDTDSEHFKKTFGKKIDKAKKGGVFKKVKKTKVNGQERSFARYNISGPLSMKGLVDGGDFSINYIVGYVNSLSRDYISNVINSEEWKANPSTINLNLQAHSRGAVGTTVGIQVLMDWVKNKAPEALDYLKINYLQYDPVPGPDTMSSRNIKSDFREFSKNVNVTTITSTYVDHAAFFTPMHVRGQNRLIVQANNHSVGLADMDITQKDAMGNQKLHRKALIDPKTKQAYRGSGMNELPNAVFLQDANGTLVRMRSFAQAYHIIKDSRNAAKLQGARADVVNRMIKEWFIDNEFVDETETDEEYFEEKKRVDEVMDTLLEHKRIQKDSDLMVKVKDTLRDVKEARTNTEMTDKRRRQIYRDAIDACKAYMEDRNPSTNIGKERLAMVGDVLSQLRAEIHRINNSMPN